MGCLFEILCEIFVEGFLELFGYLYIKLMGLIVPKSAPSPKVQKVIRVIAYFTAAVLGLMLLAGLVLSTVCEGEARAVGNCLIWASTIIIAVQILAGIIMKIISALKKK